MTYTGSAILGNSLIVLHPSECTCSGDVLTYECRVVDGSATVWRGSAFDCPSSGGEIVLRHSQVASGGAVGVCNNGAIVGQGVSVVDNCFTSQLNVTLSSRLNGKSVECAHFNNVNTAVVSNSLVNITTGMNAIQT